MKLLTVCSVGSVIFLLSQAADARADTILYIDDASGNIGRVDITTQTVVAGSVHSTGQSLTDIGFGAGGALYGTTFSGLYSINPNTGASTNLGGYNSVNGMNALVGTGGTTLLGASNNTSIIYSINPASPGTLTSYAMSPAASAGDLAFSGGALYESGVNGASGNDELVNVTTASVVSLFHVGTSGGTTLSGVFGLADDGTTLYGVDGTEVYSVNVGTAVLTPLFDYSAHENGQALGAANGTAFISEGAPAPVPEPVTLTLLGTGLAGLGVLRRRSR